MAISKVPSLPANPRVASWLIRLGLIVVFLYAAVSGLRDPQAWVSFLPAMLVRHFDAQALLKVFAVYEVLLSVWLLSGHYVRLAGAVCAATFVGIIFSNFNAFSITFRDIALAFASLALVFMDE